MFMEQIMRKLNGVNIMRILLGLCAGYVFVSLVFIRYKMYQSNKCNYTQYGVAQFHPPPLPRPCIEALPGQQSRKQQVKETCTLLGIPTHFNISKTNVQDWHIWVDDKRKVMMCSISKAGGTYWRYLLMVTHPSYVKMHGDVLKKNKSKFPWFVPKTAVSLGLRLLHSYSQADAKHRIENYVKVLFVRHPLDRMLSAYRNYLTPHKEGAGIPHLETKRELIRDIRSGNTNNFNPPEFPEFVQHLAESYRLGTNFSRFKHWDSFGSHCEPCAVHYDHIVKFENMAGEGICPYSLFTGKEESDLPALPYTTHSAIYTPKGRNTKELTHAFYKTLTGPQLVALKHMCRTDCIMFGYDCDVYNAM